MGLIGTLLAGATKGLHESVRRDVADQKRIEEEKRAEQRAIESETRQFGRQKEIAQFSVDRQLEAEEHREDAAQKRFKLDWGAAKADEDAAIARALQKKGEATPAPATAKDNLRSAYTGEFDPAAPAKPTKYEPATLSLSETARISKEAAAKTGNPKVMAFYDGLYKDAVDFERGQKDEAYRGEMTGISKRGQDIQEKHYQDTAARDERQHKERIAEIRVSRDAAEKAAKKGDEKWGVESAKALLNATVQEIGKYQDLMEKETDPARIAKYQKHIDDLSREAKATRDSVNGMMKKLGYEVPPGGIDGGNFVERIDEPGDKQGGIIGEAQTKSAPKPEPDYVPPRQPIQPAGTGYKVAPLVRPLPPAEVERRRRLEEENAKTRAKAKELEQERKQKVYRGE